MIHAMVIISGGLDSLAAMGYAKENYDSFETLVFDYGQTNYLEIELSERCSKKMGATKHHVQDIRSAFLGMKSTMLKDSQEATKYVPNRNTVILALGHGLAEAAGATDIVTGMGGVDEGGASPDNGVNFLQSYRRTLSLGNPKSNIRLVTPLVGRFKWEVWSLLDKYDLIDIAVKDTFTCHKNVNNYNDWGYGCGECDACKLRKKGFYQWLNKMYPVTL